MTSTRGITSLRVLIADVPTIRPHILAMATLKVQPLVLLFIERSDGAIGLGEATTIGGLAYGEESPESIKVNLETYFAPILAGCDADDIPATMATLDQHIVGNRFAKNAVETALLDALGHARGIPLHQLIGNKQQDRLEVAWTLASGDTSRDIEEGEVMLSQRRHRHFKIKIGKREVEEDCGHVAAIARAFEGRATVRVDVNQAWSRNQARQGAAILQDAGVVLIEQPLSGDDWEGMRALRDTFDIAIMADEALTGPASAKRLAHAGAADVFSLKIAQSGGLAKTRTVASIATDHDIALYGGTMLEGAVGTLASAHLFSCLPAFAWHTELFGPLLLAEELLETPLRYENFGLVVPDTPGLGLKIDQDKLNAFKRP